MGNIFISAIVHFVILNSLNYEWSRGKKMERSNGFELPHVMINPLKTKTVSSGLGYVLCQYTQKCTLTESA